MKRPPPIKYQPGPHLITSRRTFLLGTAATLGMTVVSTPLLSMAASLASPVRQETLSLCRIVYDPRHPASARFGAQSEQAGHATHAMRGDVTELWTEYLAEQWRKQPVAIAGMTHADALFVLERLGWDHGLRVTFRAEHRVQANGITTHSIAGPESMLASCAALAAQRYEWADCMAGVVRYPPRQAILLAERSLAMSGNYPTDSARPLYTWVITPHHRIV